MRAAFRAPISQSEFMFIKSRSRDKLVFTCACVRRRESLLTPSFTWPIFTCNYYTIVLSKHSPLKIQFPPFLLLLGVNGRFSRGDRLPIPFWISLEIHVLNFLFWKPKLCDFCLVISNFVVHRSRCRFMETPRILGGHSHHLGHHREVPVVVKQVCGLPANT